MDLNTILNLTLVGIVLYVIYLVLISIALPISHTLIALVLVVVFLIYVARTLGL